MLTLKSLDYRIQAMRNERNRVVIDFDQVLRDIQEENHRRLSSILEEQIPAHAIEPDKTEKRVRAPRILDLFILSRSR